MSKKDSGDTNHSGEGLHKFSQRLKQELSNRIDTFARDLEYKYKDDPDAIASKSTDEWMEEYKLWVKTRNELRELAEQYLLGDF